MTRGRGEAGRVWLVVVADRPAPSPSVAARSFVHHHGSRTLLRLGQTHRGDAGRAEFLRNKGHRGMVGVEETVAVGAEVEGQAAEGGAPEQQTGSAASGSWSTAC